MLYLMMFFSLYFAWWEMGHMLTSSIAQFILINKYPNSYRQVNQLIQAFSQITDNKSNTFIQSAVWADDIKQQGFIINNDYHFIDRFIFFIRPYITDGLMVGPTDIQKDINIISMIQQIKQVLKFNKQKITFQRAFMARFLIHFIGDIHQPLHATNMFNQSYPKGDIGGNLIKITTLDNKKTNLHSFLDSIAGIIQQIDGGKIERPLQLLQLMKIRKLAQRIMYEFPISQLSEQMNKTNPIDWSLEGLQISKNIIYPQMAKTNKSSAQFTLVVYKILRKRIALGGYRLAKLIKDILD